MIIGVLNYRKEAAKIIHVENYSVFFFRCFHIFNKKKKIYNSNLIQTDFAPGCSF